MIIHNSSPLDLLLKCFYNEGKSSFVPETFKEQFE